MLSSNASTGDRENGPLEQFVSYIIAVRDKPASEELRDIALRRAFDALIALITGINEPDVERIRTLAIRKYRDEGIPIPFTGKTSNIVGSLKATVAAMTVLDFDDGDREARGHVGALAIATAFILGPQTKSASGKWLDAAIAGYEVGVPIAKAFLGYSDQPNTKGYANTGVWGVFVVVAVAGVLFEDLSKEQLKQAFAIAGALAPNMMHSSSPASYKPRPECCTVKEGMVWAAEMGMEGIDLAREGCTGSTTIFDCPYYNFEEDLKLGSHEQIRMSYTKSAAICRHIQGPIENLDTLAGAHEIKLEEIENITVYSHRGAERIPNPLQPRNIYDAQYSIPICIAIVFYFGKAAVLPLTTSTLATHLDNQDVTSLIPKVKVVVDKKLDECYPAESLSRVVIQCKNETYSSEVKSPTGEKVSWQDLSQKFEGATQSSLDRSQRRAVLDASDRAREGDMDALMDCFTSFNLCTAVA